MSECELDVVVRRLQWRTALVGSIIGGGIKIPKLGMLGHLPREICRREHGSDIAYCSFYV